MAWSAHVDSKSMAFGSDDVLYHSKGNVHYRLDKNWKRQDWYYQRGVQRNLGQGPCAPENMDSDLSEGPVLACRRNSDEYATMIHRNSKMFFISWKNNTGVGSSDPNQIAECNWMDLQVVGNIRNDCKILCWLVIAWFPKPAPQTELLLLLHSHRVHG